MLSKFQYLCRNHKYLFLILLDTLCLCFVYWLAMGLRSQPIDSLGYNPQLMLILPTSVSSVLVFARLGVYREIISFVGNRRLALLLLGVTISTTIAAALGFLFQGAVSFSALVIYWVLGVLVLGGARMFVQTMPLNEVTSPRNKIIIYGAGKSGLELSSVLLHNKQIKALAFIDDDISKQGCVLNGLQVYSPDDLDRLLANYGPQRIVLALGNTPRGRRSQLVKNLEAYPLQIQTVPPKTELVEGNANIEDMRDLDLEDLLGRDEVETDYTVLSASISNKVIMVTGAGGSIGSELCRQIIRLNPGKLILFELSELALYQIEEEILVYVSRNKLKVEVHAILGSVQKRGRMEAIMKSYAVNVIYHAAAYKHVHIVEHNVIEGVRNNVFGTWYCAEAAISAGVDAFVLISSDKAVRPANVMGASKRLSELVLQGLSQRQNHTRFCMVRFGNVIGSSGSVIPLFRRQIAEGGPVTVTHPEMSRYFMTLSEAVTLVLIAGSKTQGGEVYCLDMGNPVNISDLARKLVHIQGLEVKGDNKPKGSIEILYTGLRSGEKIREELWGDTKLVETSHPRIKKGREISLTCLSWSPYCTELMAFVVTLTVPPFEQNSLKLLWLICRQMTLMIWFGSRLTSNYSNLKVNRVRVELEHNPKSFQLPKGLIRASLS